jgi:hypothetical protein
MLSLAPGARTGVDGHTPAPNVIFEFEFEFELLGNSWQFMAIRRNSWQITFKIFCVF